MKNISSKKSKGFTLIEIVVVLAIIGVLIVVLLPNITGFMSGAGSTGENLTAKSIYTAYIAACAENNVDPTDAATVTGTKQAAIIESIEKNTGVTGVTISSVTTDPTTGPGTGASGAINSNVYINSTSKKITAGYGTKGLYTQ